MGAREVALGVSKNPDRLPEWGSGTFLELEMQRNQVLARIKTLLFGLSRPGPSRRALLDELHKELAHVEGQLEALALDK